MNVFYVYTLPTRSTLFFVKNSCFVQAGEAFTMAGQPNQLK
jgi:hypothetical protein